MKITKSKQVSEILNISQDNILEVDKEMAKHTRKQMRKCFGLIQCIRDMKMKKQFENIYGFYTQMSFCVLVQNFKNSLSEEWKKIINDKIDKLVNNELTYGDMINMVKYIKNLSTFKENDSVLTLTQDIGLFYYWMNRYAEE